MVESRFRYFSYLANFEKLCLLASIQRSIELNYDVVITIIHGVWSIRALSLGS